MYYYILCHYHDIKRGEDQRGRNQTKATSLCHQSAKSILETFGDWQWLAGWHRQKAHWMFCHINHCGRSADDPFDVATNGPCTTWGAPQVGTSQITPPEVKRVHCPFWICRIISWYGPCSSQEIEEPYFAPSSVHHPAFDQGQHPASTDRPGIDSCRVEQGERRGTWILVWSLRDPSRR